MVVTKGLTWKAQEAISETGYWKVMMMSKFNSALAERLYAISMEGGEDESIGSVDELDWVGLFIEERTILVEDSQGFVDAITYDTEDEMHSAYRGVVGMYSNYWNAGEES